MPEAQPDRRTESSRKVGLPEDGDHAGRVAERRELGHEGRLNLLRLPEPVGERRSLGVHEHLDGLDPRIQSGLDQVLALADEEAELFALAPSRELPDELQAGI